MFPRGGRARRGPRPPRKRSRRSGPAPAVRGTPAPRGTLAAPRGSGPAGRHPPAPVPDGRGGGRAGPPDPARGRGRGRDRRGLRPGEGCRVPAAARRAARAVPAGGRAGAAGRGAARDGGAGRAADGAGGGRCPRRTASGAGGRAVQPAPPRAPPPEFPDGVADWLPVRGYLEGAVPACGAARSLRQPAGARFGLGAGGGAQGSSRRRAARCAGYTRRASASQLARRFAGKKPDFSAGSCARTAGHAAASLPGPEDLRLGVGSAGSARRSAARPFRVRRICASAGAARAGGGGGPAAGGGEARPGGPRPLPRQGPRLPPPGRVGGGIGGPASGRRPDADRLYIAPVYYAALRALRHGFARARRNGSAAPRASDARRCRCRRGRRRGGRPGRGPAPARCGRAGGCRRVRRGAGACGSGMRGGPACRGSFGGGGGGHPDGTTGRQERLLPEPVAPYASSRSADRPNPSNTTISASSRPAAGEPLVVVLTTTLPPTAAVMHGNGSIGEIEFPDGHMDEADTSVYVLFGGDVAVLSSDPALGAPSRGEARRECVHGDRGDAGGDARPRVPVRVHGASRRGGRHRDRRSGVPARRGPACTGRGAGRRPERARESTVRRGAGSAGTRGPAGRGASRRPEFGRRDQGGPRGAPRGRASPGARRRRFRDPRGGPGGARRIWPGLASAREVAGTRTR